VYLPLALGASQASIAFLIPYLKGDYQKFTARGWAVVALGVILALTTAGLAAFNAWAARQEKLKGDAYAALLAAAAKIADAAVVPVRLIGLSAYMVRRPFPRLWHPYQTRLARVRLANFPPPSTIVWTRGKGFLGECWAKQDRVIDRHIPTRYREYLGCDEAKWLSAPPELRVGLSFREWEGTQQRYKYIRVAPILTPSGDSYRYAGCVSLDTGDDQSAQKLATDQVRELLLDAAGALMAALRAKA
jgi:hypothetical protein